MEKSSSLTIDNALLLTMENLKKTLYSTKNEYLKTVLEYFFSSTGKELRPRLLLFSAEISGGITNRSIRAAELVSLLHSATLIHDDIVDDAKLRRNIPTVNKKWNNSMAVLLGDYVFAHLMQTAIINSDYDFLEIISNTIKNMIEGEFLQQKTKKKYVTNESEKICNLVSYQKTACFFENCCKLGAISTENTKELKTLQSMGKNIGMAFQLKDDILDYQPKENGKGYGNDFRSGIITLPLVYSLKNSSKSNYNLILKNFGNNNLINEEFLKIVTLIEKTNGLKISFDEIEKNKNQAIYDLRELQKKYLSEELYYYFLNNFF